MREERKEQTVRGEAAALHHEGHVAERAVGQQAAKDGPQPAVKGTRCLESHDRRRVRVEYQHVA